MLGNPVGDKPRPTGKSRHNIVLNTVSLSSLKDTESLPAHLCPVHLTCRFAHLSFTIQFSVQPHSRNPSCEQASGRQNTKQRYGPRRVNFFRIAWK